MDNTRQSFTHALFHLAANPRYIQPLREEVEAITKEEGWSKAALGKMRKIDSFLRECQRVEGFSSGMCLYIRSMSHLLRFFNPLVGLLRKTLKDFTFSDSTFVPKGTVIVTPMRSIHHDKTFYENAHAFEPFRFADLHEEDGADVRYQFTSTTTEYLPFGHGRYAWYGLSFSLFPITIEIHRLYVSPGRFFAASELKSMLAHVVVMYDVKLADNATRPRTLHFATVLMPDPNAEVMFRRRAD